MSRFIVNWILSAIAIAIAAYLLPGVSVSGLGALLITAIVLGAINAFIRPIIILLTLPLNVLTLGLFTLVINALLIMLTSAIVPGFMVSGFWTALGFSLVLTVINWLIHGWSRD